MLQFDDFFAWIEVDGDHLPEYRVEYSREKKQVKCWIPSQAGKVRLWLVLTTLFTVSLRLFLCTGDTGIASLLLQVESTLTDPSLAAGCWRHLVVLHTGPLM